MLSTRNFTLTLSFSVLENPLVGVIELVVFEAESLFDVCGTRCDRFYMNCPIEAKFLLPKLISENQHTLDGACGFVEAFCVEPHVAPENIRFADVGLDASSST